MNEKSKRHMEKQHKMIYEGLSDTFGLPVFEDEAAENEDINSYNYFLVVYGPMKSTESNRHLSQEVYVVYISEDNPDVETTTVDIISTISKVPGVEFHRSGKDRLQKKDLDEFIDQVTLIFKRKIAYECQI